MNTPVNFELAKLLKEKGFDKDIKGFWIETIEHELDVPRDGVMIFPSIPPRILDHLPKENYHIFHAVAPTIADVVMWLYEKHDIWMWVSQEFTDSNDFCYRYRYENNFTPPIGAFNSSTEAYISAIEYVLSNLI